MAVLNTDEKLPIDIIYDLMNDIDSIYDKLLPFVYGQELEVTNTELKIPEYIRVFLDLDTMDFLAKGNEDTVYLGLIPLKRYFNQLAEHKSDTLEVAKLFQRYLKRRKSMYTKMYTHNSLSEFVKNAGAWLTVEQFTKSEIAEVFKDITSEFIKDAVTSGVNETTMMVTRMVLTGYLPYRLMTKEEAKEISDTIRVAKRHHAL